MGPHRLLTAERERRILQLLKGQRVVSVTELSRELGVSVATVRRDIQGLDERGLLVRVRGGAMMVGDSRAEPLFSDKEGKQTAEKERIAHLALSLVEDHDSIYLDGGSTVLALARLLDERNDLTIVTNSLMAAAELMQSRHRVILVGGEFRAISRTLVGPLTVPIISSLNVDKAFMGTIGFAVADGLTTTDPSEAFTKTEIMKRSRRVILLADHTKLGTCSLARSEGSIDLLITDRIDPELHAQLRELEIEVYTASNE
ncbi:MAG: DeoR/GlpR transcriptional regulator [Victivallales bacterium]|jgi:DeoR family transcriptional regulator, fructose operon transcriptional repressor|nr:DeoR/GlpR transcriptional regulator [Victivallales bacterium]MBT7298248.1 DeoR/GlpR transcriptional regulator [Victivallales bacterium]